MGFRFPSISLHNKLSQLLVEEWGASPADPALLLHFSETILSNSNLKNIKKKQSRKLNHKNFGR